MVNTRLNCLIYLTSILRAGEQRHIFALAIFSHSLRFKVFRGAVNILTRPCFFALILSSKQFKFLSFLRLLELGAMAWSNGNVPVKSKLKHLPPGQPPPPRHLNLWKISVQIPSSPGRKAVQMSPPPGKLQ